jgi:uncharacterized low-complexity protein
VIGKKRDDIAPFIYTRGNFSMKKIGIRPLATLIGTTFVGTLSIGVGGAANAAENPFALKDLATGYTHVAETEAAKEKKEMACGAQKRDAETTKPQEDKAAQQKTMEGKCGAGMKMDSKPAPPPKAP